MEKTSQQLIDECQTLRRRGFTLGEIMRATGLPRTTVYGYISRFPLSPDIKQRLIRQHTERINAFNHAQRGHARSGRNFRRPQQWSRDLIFLVAHFMFDGRICHEGCHYYNRSDFLIQEMREKSLKNFKLESKIELRKGGVKALSYYNVEFGEYIREKALELRVHIRLSSLEEKRVFLQSFFDDEGNISFNIKRSKRQVRGFQYDLSLLRIVRILLMDFGIPSTVDETYKEIIISRKGNLMKFRDFINFSEGIYINPERTNSIWKRELSKRQLLNMAIESYRPLGAPGVHKSPRFS